MTDITLDLSCLDSYLQSYADIPAYVHYRSMCIIKSNVPLNMGNSYAELSFKLHALLRHVQPTNCNV